MQSSKIVMKTNTRILVQLLKNSSTRKSDIIVEYPGTRYSPMESLNQGSQTQSDSRAASDSKKGLAGRIEKSEKNNLQISSKN